MKLSKRAFIRLLTLGGSLIPGIATLAAEEAATNPPIGKARVLQGPMLGAVTATSARIWMRASDAFSIAVEFSINEDFQDSRQTLPQTVVASNDFTATILVDGLTQDTRYFYRILINGKQPKYSNDSPNQLFRTAPGYPARFSVATGSCARVAEDPYQLIWKIVARHSPDLFFWLGDNIYGDSPRSDVLADEYQRQRSVESFFPVGARIPQLAIWDDHDFGINDGDGTYFAKDVSLEVFKRYWANPDYGQDDTAGVFFRYDYGGVDFFFLDVRYYRDPNDQLDHAGKTMLGSKQKAWLKNALLDSVAPFTILVSSSGWTVAKGPGGDSWSSYLHERDELFEFIRQNNVSGVVLVSGDTHVAELNAIPWSEKGGYDYYDLISSPLAQDTTTTWLARRPERRIRQVYSGSVNFGMLTFDMIEDDPVLEYRVFNYIGDSVWEPFRLRASELTNGSSTWSTKMDDLSRSRYASAIEGGEYYQSLPVFRD